MSLERKVRVRFAPSPTGPLHLGGVRTALYNYLFAKKMGGDFILRIEDTDQARFVPGAEEYIRESLNWAGIHYTEGPEIGGPFGPYRQSERKDIYKQYAMQLIDSGNAYYAFDTTEELDEMRDRASKSGSSAAKYDSITREYMKNSLTLPADEVKARLEAGDNYVIRAKIPRNEEVKLHDIIRGWVSVRSGELDDKVLFKSDGMPTYHLANIVDDYLMKITHVIRGEEWLPSAPLHVLLYRFLGWEEVMPKFAHLPLILKPDGNGKLSKRDGDRLGFPVFSLDWVDPFTGEKSSGYREAGYLPSAYVNILALLGWHPSDNRELFTMDELVEAFSLERVSKSGAKFDPEKAKWFNHQYLKSADNEELAKLFLPELNNKGINVSNDFLIKAVGLMKEKAHYVSEFWSIGNYLFQEPTSYDEVVIIKKLDDTGKILLREYIAQMESKNPIAPIDFQTIYEEICNTMSLKPGQYMQLVRLSISGNGGGPGLWDILSLLGTGEIVKRINHFLEKF